MHRRGLKPVVLVELLGLVAQGMDEKASYARILRNRYRATDGVLQQGSAQVHPLRSAIDRDQWRHEVGSRLRS